jgi:hypothetical protein
MGSYENPAIISLEAMEYCPNISSKRTAETSTKYPVLIIESG